jgi:branched-chain amino acid transport system substrate-binding protein
LEQTLAALPAVSPAELVSTTLWSPLRYNQRTRIEGVGRGVAISAIVPRAQVDLAGDRNKFAGGLMRSGLTAIGVAGLMACALVLAWPGAAQPLPGVSDSEIRIGNLVPYSGPAAAYGDLGRVHAAFFAMVNDLGGINGRRVTLLSNDDGYSPPRTLEQARRLVERDDVLLIFQSLGTPTNLAIRDYMNEMGVPQLFMATGSPVFDDPVNYPWTMRWNPSFESEARVYADYILETFEQATIGVLYQNDDSGRSAVAVLAESIAGRFPIVSQPYDQTDPTVDAQVAALQAAGVTVFVNLAIGRFAAQSIRRAAELQWRPHHILYSGSASIAETFMPAGLENAVGIITTRHSIDPADPAFADHPGRAEFVWFMENYLPGRQYTVLEAYAYNVASALVEVLRRCGNDLSRADVMEHAANLTDLALPMLIPGITVNTSPTDYAPIEAFQMARFDGNSFVPFGAIIDTANQ